jgi:hypothetical protein
VLTSTLLHAIAYVFHNFLNVVLVQFVNKVGLQKMKGKERIILNLTFVSLYVGCKVKG